MPWRISSAMSQRHEFVLLASQERANVRQLCRQFGISSATTYKWLHRFRAEGVQGLQELNSPESFDLIGSSLPRRKLLLLNDVLLAPLLLLPRFDHSERRLRTALPRVELTIWQEVRETLPLSQALASHG